MVVESRGDTSKVGSNGCAVKPQVCSPNLYALAGPLLRWVRVTS